MEQVAGHDGVSQSFGNQIPVGLKLFGLPGFGYIGETKVGVGAGAAMPGKVLEATEHISSVVGPDPFTGVDSDGLGGGGKAAVKFADYRIVRKRVEVDDWGQIEVDANGLEGVGCAQGMDGGEGSVIFLAKLGGACRCRKTQFGLESADFAAFLVHGNEQWGVGESLEDGDEGLELIGGEDVVMILFFGECPVKEDDPAQVSSDDINCHWVVCSNGAALESEEKELSYFVFDIHGLCRNVVGVKASRLR